MPKRRDVLSAAAAALVLSCARSALAQPVLKAIHIGSTPLIDGVPLVRAVASGAFHRAGLDVTVEKSGSGSAIAAAIVGGSIDMGTVSPGTLINAYDHKIPLQIVYHDRLHLAGRPYPNAIIVAADGPIRTSRDLNGKIVSVGAIKDSSWTAARAFIDATGGDSSTVKFVELPFSAVAAALEAGRLDGGVVVNPFLAQALHAGRTRDLGDLLSFGGARLVEITYAATRDYVQSNKEAMQRFVQVMHETQEWCNAHKNETSELAVSFTGADRTALAPETVNFATDMNPKEVQPWIAAAVKYQVISRSFDATELY